ncbi:hypothetical protein [Enterocloster asparagiformis]|uniref:hypothetical protein n=1 Tax=Enterocloster asparagiformis TaxID=333367 RepID=UPI002A83F9EB|nr:hypothetical protein [Enterocloster asparagiformis]
MSKGKSIAKSIRMTEEVFAYINGYQGEGFNQKFENIILEAMCGEAERKRRLNALDISIEHRKDELHRMYDQISFYRAIYRDLKAIESSVREYFPEGIPVDSDEE